MTLSLKTIFSWVGILLLGFVCACAGSHDGQVALPTRQKNNNFRQLGKDVKTTDSASEQKTEPFVFEQDEYNIYM